MACDIQTALDDAKCFFCLSPGQLNALKTSLLCVWAGGAVPPAGANVRVTDTGDVRVTDSGERRITG